MASESEKRFLIILTALGEVHAGSHYLKGADGAVFENKNFRGEFSFSSFYNFFDAIEKVYSSQKFP